MSYTLKILMACVKIATIFLSSMYKLLIGKIITEAENSGKQKQCEYWEEENDLNEVQ